MIVPIIRERLRHKGQSSRPRVGRYQLTLLLRHLLEIRTASSAAAAAVAVAEAATKAAVI